MGPKVNMPLKQLKAGDGPVSTESFRPRLGERASKPSWMRGKHTLRAGLGRLMAKEGLTGWMEGVGGPWLRLAAEEGQDRGVLGGDLRGSTTQGCFFFYHNRKSCLLLFTVSSQTKNKS